MHGEQPLLRGLFDSGRKVLAGMLFLLPGVVSDVMALALLALRFNLGREYAPHAATAGDYRGGPEVDRRRVPPARLIPPRGPAATSSGRAPSAPPCPRAGTRGAA